MYDPKMISTLQKAAIEFTDNLEPVITAIGNAQLVLLGEATHGTHEFYTLRAQLSQQLITNKGFNAIAIEGDWPDAYQVNRYIHGQAFNHAHEALASFDRFPTWMWRNVPMVALIEWLAQYNKKQQNPLKIVSFFGLDLYSLYRSIDAVITYFDQKDPEVAAVAREHYSCFDHVKPDPEQYGHAVFTKLLPSCEPAVLAQLKEVHEATWDLLSHGQTTADEAFYIDQNAQVVKDAEQYYRSLFISDVSTWNLRDSHMMQTVQAIIKHYQLKGIKEPKIIIWAHNSHLGNAAATQMGERGEYNIGQLAKEAFGKKAYALGFTTYHGSVSAASAWHAPVERKQVRDGLPNSYEHLFHAVGMEQFFLSLRDGSIVPHPLLERAIGVVYRPRTERASHYFYADLSAQFDGIIHCDKTRAVEPLEKTSHWIAGEVPETYPSGL